MVRNGIQVLKDPDTSLIVAGIALAPVAVLAFQTVPTGLGMGALLSNSAFLGGMTASLFSVFDISKALQNKGKLPRMTHKGIGRVINTAADPENIATVGLMFTAAMAGPVGWLLAPVIGMGGVVATINAQKTDYSNKGRPKLWFAAACALSATASLATGQVQAMGAVIANYVFAASYVRLETYESDDFLGSMKRSLKKIISSPLQQRKASNAKTTKKDISQGVTPAIHIDNAEKGGGISKQVSARPNPKKRIGLLPIFARFGRPQQKKKTPKKNRTTNPKNL